MLPPSEFSIGSTARSTLHCSQDKGLVGLEHGELHGMASRSRAWVAQWPGGRVMRSTQDLRHIDTPIVSNVSPST